MPIVKISTQSHSIIKREQVRLTAERGRRVTQAEIVEAALVALMDDEPAAPCGGCGSIIAYSHKPTCPSLPTEVIA